MADTFDAITTKRSYRQSRPHKAALDIMRNEAGAQLDPDAVRAFRSAYFGRRWLWVPAGAINAATRLLAFGTTRLADTGAIAASTLALGGAVIAPATPSHPIGAAHISRVGAIAHPGLRERALSRLIATSARPASHAGASKPGASHFAHGSSAARGNDPDRQLARGHERAGSSTAKPIRPAVPGGQNGGSIGSPGDTAPTATVSAAGASASLSVPVAPGRPAPTEVGATVTTPGALSASAGATASTRSTTAHVAAPGGAGVTVTASPIPPPTGAVPPPLG